MRELGQLGTQGRVNQFAKVRDAGFEGEWGQVEIYPLRCKETTTNVHVDPRCQIREKVSGLTHCFWEAARSSFGSRWWGHRGIDCTASNDYVRRALAELGRSRTERPAEQRAIATEHGNLETRLHFKSTGAGSAALATTLLHNAPLARKSSGQTES